MAQTQQMLRGLVTNFLLACAVLLMGSLGVEGQGATIYPQPVAGVTNSLGGATNLDAEMKSFNAPITGGARITILTTTGIKHQFGKCSCHRRVDIVPDHGVDNLL